MLDVVCLLINECKHLPSYKTACGDNRGFCMILKPKYVFKYKSLNEKLQIQRVIDILQNDRIYIPTYQELNDPLESSAACISLGVAGFGYHADMGERHPIVDAWMNQYRILSFSAKWNLYTMWAHYAGDYNGCCLIYSTMSAFSDVFPVVYTDEVFYIGEYEEDRIAEEDWGRNAIRESFMFKKKEWENEHEWRYVCDSTISQMPYNRGELCGIILGSKVSKCTQRKITKICLERNVPCMKVFRDEYRGVLTAFPVDITQNQGETIYEMIERVENGECNEAERNLFFEINDIRVYRYL